MDSKIALVGPDKTPWHSRLSKWAGLLAGALCLVGGIAGLYGLLPADPLIGLGAGAVFLILGRVDEFESIKGLGFEAKTRAIDLRIERLDAIAGQVRQLSEIAGKQLASLAATIGRFDSAPSPTERKRLAQQIERLMRESGSSEPAINEALRPIVRSICVDICSHVAHRALDVAVAGVRLLEGERAHLQSNASDVPGQLQKIEQRIDELHSRIHELRMITAAPFDCLPERMLTVLNALPTELPTRAQILELGIKAAGDISTYRDTGTLPNEGEWFARAFKTAEGD